MLDQSAPTQKREAWFIPVAIIVAGVILAVATFAYRNNDVEGSVVADISLLRPVSEDDHIIGNPAASVVLIEYADIDSPPAKSFQQTMTQLMAEYAESGKVAWVYRHLPLIDQHVYAAQHAEAAECIATLGGPNIFWRFIDALNSAAPGDLQFDPANYEGVVSSFGILPQSFNDCVRGRQFEQRVSRDFENGLAIGAGGSPFSVLLVRGKPPVTIDGAVPYDALKRIISEAVAQAEQ